MFLGPGGAGKSSLKNGLMGKRFNANQKSTIVAEYHQVRPVDREWVREGLIWNKVTEEDETKELAQLMVLAQQSGSLKVDAYIHSSSETDFVHHTSFLQEVHEIANVHVIDSAVAKSKNLAPEDIHLQPFLYLWDCGGQPVFLEVLPTFLTSHTMFLLVFDASRSLKERMPSLHYEEGQRIHHGMTNTTTLQLMEKWMTNIHAYLVKVDEKGVAEGYPRINVVGTRGDLLSFEEKRKKERELEERFCLCLFNEVVEDYMIINNTTAGTDTEDENFMKLRKQVHEFVTNCLKVKTPVKWALFRKVLQRLVAQKSYNILTFDEISSTATTVCKIDPEHVVSMLNFHHELGVLLYYPHVCSLKDKVILSPRWFVKCLAKVLTLPGEGVAGGHRMKREWDLLQSKGILVEPLYTVAWKDCDSITPEEMIDLLVSFHLAAKVKVKAEEDGYPRPSVRKYFVPCVLQYKPPPHIMPLNFPIQSCAVAPLHITFTTKYVVPGFFVRLAAVMAESPEFSLYFNDGIYHDFIKYSFGTSRAITVSLTDITHAIQISIDSTLADPHSWFERDCAVLLDLIPRFCEKVENSLRPNGFAGFEKRGISLSEMKSELHIVCQGEECQTKDKPHYLVGTPVDGQIYCTESGRFRELFNLEKYWFIKNRDTTQVPNSQSTDSVMQPRPCPKKHVSKFPGLEPGQDDSEQNRFGTVNTSIPTTAVRPTVAELCSELVELVNWENIVIHLPEMIFAEIQKVKRNEPKVDQQKQEAFNTWLRRCPEASWSHVRDALHKAGEYAFEKKIATNHGLSLVFSEDPSRRTQDDTAITCPGTTVQKGSMTVDSTRDTQCGSHYSNLVPTTQDPPLGLGAIKQEPLMSLGYTTSPVSAATPTVPVVATPIVPVSAIPTVPVAATPTVPVAATPIVPVAATPIVPVTATLTVPVAATPIVSVMATPTVQVIATPIVPELCCVLRDVMDWEKVVIQLPKMSAFDVDEIRKMSGDLNSRKEEAFDTWLRRYPEASWSHVRDALHKAGEFYLETKVAEKYSLPLLAESIPMREVFSSQTNFTTDGTIDGRQPNIGPQFPVLLAPPPSSNRKKKEKKKKKKRKSSPHQVHPHQVHPQSLKPAEDADGSILIPDSDSVIQPRPQPKKYVSKFPGLEPDQLDSSEQKKFGTVNTKTPIIAVSGPTVSELCSELVDLADWEVTVIHLPEMSSAEVQKVKLNEPKVDQQKRKAFDTWLRRCPEASWSHVRDALHKAGEYNLEKKIATNHSLEFSEEDRTVVQTGNMVVVPLGTLSMVAITLILCLGFYYLGSTTWLNKNL